MYVTNQENNLLLSLSVSSFSLLLLFSYSILILILILILLLFPSSLLSLILQSASRGGLISLPLFEGTTARLPTRSNSLQLLFIA